MIRLLTLSFALTASTAIADSSSTHRLTSRHSQLELSNERSAAANGQNTYIVHADQSPGVDCNEFFTAVYNDVLQYIDESKAIFDYQDRCIWNVPTQTWLRVMVWLAIEPLTVDDISYVDDYVSRFDGYKHSGITLRFQPVDGILLSMPLAAGSFFKDSDTKLDPIFNAVFKTYEPSMAMATDHLGPLSDAMQSSDASAFVEQLARTYGPMVGDELKSRVLPKANGLRVEPDITFITRNREAIDWNFWGLMLRDCRDAANGKCG